MALFKIDKAITVKNKTFKKVDERDIEGFIEKNPSVPAAKVGTLTTRTSASVGTLTMASGHGITNGAKISIFWEGGSRSNVTVGTVSTNSVPFSLGAGSDLPANNSAITAMVRQTEPIPAVTGDDVVALVANSPIPGHVTFAADDNTELYTVPFGHGETGDTWEWNNQSGLDNPLEGVTAAKIFFAHGDSTKAQKMYACGYFD